MNGGFDLSGWRAESLSPPLRHPIDSAWNLLKSNQDTIHKIDPELLKLIGSFVGMGVGLPHLTNWAMKNLPGMKEKIEETSSESPEPESGGYGESPYFVTPEEEPDPTGWKRYIQEMQREGSESNKLTMSPEQQMRLRESANRVQAAMTAAEAPSIEAPMSINDAISVLDNYPNQ